MSLQGPINFNPRLYLGKLAVPEIKPYINGYSD